MEPISALASVCNHRDQEHAEDMTDRDEFRAWVRTALYEAELALHAFEVKAYDVAGDMAYTAGLEHTSASVDGQPRTYTLRATQVYRRECGEWRVAHRHGDTVTA
jgi:ketosteroid isomerase-like protein